LIVVVIATFAAALISGPIITFAVPNRSNSGGATCTDTGRDSPGGLAVVECCWIEQVPKGTGWNGGDTEMYCSECENAGSAGYVNCSDPELIFNKKPITSESGGFPKGGVLQQPETSDGRDDLGNPDNDDGVLEQTETPTTQTPDKSILPGNEGLLEQPVEEEISNAGNVKNNPLVNGELREQ
jgi:hypothetical protein